MTTFVIDYFALARIGRGWLTFWRAAETNLLVFAYQKPTVPFFCVPFR